MEALSSVSTIPPSSLIKSPLCKPVFNLSRTPKKPESLLPNLTQLPKSKFRKFTAISPSVSTFAEPAAPPEEATNNLDQDEKFDWFSHWYALAPVCDLDKRAPRGIKVLGLDVVVWWDKNENEWKVFEDRCPHRLAPLSEGRIDQWGRLQCVYHGWCFGGSGDCKLIPQAPLDGPPVHTFSKACVAVYPSTVKYGIVWFWPNTDPQYKDILTKKKPPSIPELEDPSLSFQLYNRDIPYGYEVLIENFMDPSHVPYSHIGILKAPRVPSVKADREGGIPIPINIEHADKNGFTTTMHPDCKWDFVTPCVLHITDPEILQGKSAQESPGEGHMIFMCIPVSPGNSRVISAIPTNFWVNLFFPRWMFHMLQNLVIDSDLYLLRVEEEKLKEAGPSNWQKVCCVPTKADTMVTLYRNWLKKYAGGQVDWGNKFNGSLPPIPPREQLMDRYWSHVVNCSSCNEAYKGFNALKLFLQVFSVASVAIMAASKPGMISVAARYTLAVAAILCFVGSKWLSHFIYKTFRFHDYNHAFK